METESKKSSKLKRTIQKKAFTAWANSILKGKGSSPKIEDLFKSLRNGQLLGKLIESLSNDKVRGLSSAKSRQQSVDNVEICLDFLERKRVSTRGIDSEDIVDGCPDTTLELMWAIITELDIDKKELLKKGGKKTVEEALLLWAQEKTKGYCDVRVKDFTSSSWKDGLAFLALISAHRPNLIHFKDFHNDERRHNLKTAFDEAENELGIPSLLDVEDMMRSQVDERSVASYVACFYKRFAEKQRRRSRSESSSDKSDTSSSSETSRSGENRTERESRSRSTSKTKRPSRNKHRQRESSQSRSSSSRKNSSDKSKSKRGLTKDSQRGRSSSSTASSSSRSSNTNRGSKVRSGRVCSRSSSDSGSTPDDCKDRKGLRNTSEKGPRKSKSSDRSRSDGKRRSKSGNRQRSSDRSLSWTRDRTDRRSRSRERNHSLERSLSRSKHGKNRRGRSCSSSPNRRGVRNKQNKGRYKRFPASSWNKSRSPGSSRNRDGHPSSRRDKDRSPGSSRNRDGHLGSRRDKDESPGSSRDHYRYKADVGDSKGRSLSSRSQEDEYSPFGGSRYHTLNKKQRESHLNSHQPIVLDDLSGIKKEILKLKHYPGVPRSYFPSHDEDMDMIKKYLLGKNVHSQSVPLTVPANPSPVQFEWQFQDEHGAWITYGQPNSAGNGSNATTTTSDDIENHFVSNPNSQPILVQTKHNRYKLDFQSKTQENMKTNVKRFIRRIPKQSANITPINAHPFLKQPSNITPINAYTFPHTVPINPASVSFEWQFEDEHGSWISYGRPNSARNMSHITTTSSDDIEKHYVSNPANPTPLTISSKNNAQYVLDLKNKTQTNQQTSVQRRIRRVPKALPSNAKAPKGSTFVWSFKDEHDNWIKYGETSSSNEATSATTTTSDDIETKYARNPTASLEIASGHHKYILDFSAMTQTNISTHAVRDIRRQPVTPSDLPSNWSPMTPADKGLRVVQLNSTDTEYINQVKFIKKTLPSNFTINKLSRIQNEHLWMDFVNRRKRLKKTNPQITYKELVLFHGTDHKHLDSICAENLDFRLNGTHATAFGKGSYFATSAAYSANYAGSGSTKLMFIVKVLVGHYTVGDTSLRRPPKDAKSGVFYDATVDNQANPTIYVKYDNTEYYPEYYIEFT